MTLRLRNIIIITLMTIFSALPIVTICNLVKYLTVDTRSVITLLTPQTHGNNIAFFISLILFSIIIYSLSITMLYKFKFILSSEIFFSLCFLLFSLVINLKSFLISYEISNISDMYYSVAMKALFGTVLAFGIFQFCSAFFSKEIDYKRFDIVFLATTSFIVIITTKIPIDSQTVGTSLNYGSSIKYLLYAIFIMLSLSSSLIYFLTDHFSRIRERVTFGICTLIFSLTFFGIFIFNIPAVTIPLMFIFTANAIYYTRKMRNYYIWG